MKRNIIVLLLCIATLATFSGCSKATAGIDRDGPIFSEFEFGMSRSTVRSIYPEWTSPVIDTAQHLVFEEIDYKGFHAYIMFAFDIDDHTLEQINLDLKPNEENTPEKFNESVAVFNEVYGQPKEIVEDYYAIWEFKYGEDDAVLLLVYDESMEMIQTFLMRLDEFDSLYELL